jgi:hypothetical protein
MLRLKFIKDTGSKKPGLCMTRFLLFRNSIGIEKLRPLHQTP